MVKQRGYSSVKGGVQFLPTIAEEADQVPEQNGLDEILEGNFGGKKKRNNCHYITQDTRMTSRELTTGIEDLSAHTRCMCRNCSPQVLTHHQASRSEGINEARTLFPDFFPRFEIQESWEDSSWRDKPTMEQIFSGHNIDFLRKNSLHNAGFQDHWKYYQLSF